jgi:retron-type reverse transcriptase
MEEIKAALRSGRLLAHPPTSLFPSATSVVDADLSKYFDTIPHDRLLRLVARRTSDGSILHLIRQWLDAPVVEESEGRKRILPNKRGVPQGGVI